MALILPPCREAGISKEEAFSSRARKLVFTQMDGVTRKPIEREGMQLCYVKNPHCFAQLWLERGEMTTFYFCQSPLEVSIIYPLLCASHQHMDSLEFWLFSFVSGSTLHTGYLKTACISSYPYFQTDAL